MCWRARTRTNPWTHDDENGLHEHESIYIVAHGVRAAKQGSPREPLHDHEVAGRPGQPRLGDRRQSWRLAWPGRGRARGTARSGRRHRTRPGREGRRGDGSRGDHRYGVPPEGPPGGTLVSWDTRGSVRSFRALGGPSRSCRNTPSTGRSTRSPRVHVPPSTMGTRQVIQRHRGGADSPPLRKEDRWGRGSAKF